MFRLVSILLLGLLLYHTFRATVTLYLLEQSYLTADATVEEDEYVVVKLPISLPYTNTWQQSSAEGLIKHEDGFYNITEQRYANDTLYTTLKTNISAREKFFSLVEEMNSLSNSKAADNTQTSSILKLLGQSANVYISSSFILGNTAPIRFLANLYNSHASFVILSQDYPVHTPPPEFV